jgi:hypothetical protein
MLLFSIYEIINRIIFLTNFIRGIEWISHRYIISWSFYSYTSNTKSQVIITDIQCGQSTPVRINKIDEPHVLFVKVSPLK